MFSVRNLFWFLPLLALVTLQLWYPAVRTFLSPPQDISTGTPASPSDNPIQSMDMENIVLSQFTKEHRQWQIKARKLHSGDGENDFRLQEVEAQFISEHITREDSLPVTNIQSASAWYQQEKKQLLLENDVVVTTEDGFEMQTQKLMFFENQRILLADNGVHISGRDFSLQGKMMNYHIDSRYLKVSGSVSATLY